MVALRKWLNRLICLLFVTAITSCYESPEPLSKPGTVLDHALLGNWQCTSILNEGDKKVSSMGIFQFDDSQYYIEWKEGVHVSRYRAYPSLLDKYLLLNVQQIAQDTDGGKWIFAKYHLSQTNELKVAIVNEAALSSAEKNDALTHIRKRIADDALYTPLISCIRQKK